MALNLNFYHEIRKEEYARARDPLKLASMAGVGVLILMAAFYFYRLNASSHFRKEAARLRATWAKVEPQKVLAEKREKELLDGQVTNKGLVERVHGRFYWAPVLSHIARATTPEVQLQTLLADYRSGGNSGIILTGVAAGSQPRSAAEAFRRKLQEELDQGYESVSVQYDGTNSLEETMETVELDGVAYGTAKFRLRVALGQPKVKEIAVAAPLAENGSAATPAAPKSGYGRAMAKTKETLEAVAVQAREADAEIAAGVGTVVGAGKAPRPTPLNAAQVAEQKGGTR